MKISLYYLCVLFILGFSCHAISETFYYKGTMKVKNAVTPAKATYEEVDGLPEPIIKITYKISGEEYLSRYMSGFGDKYFFKQETITVYNDDSDKKQNYHFKGEKISLMKSLLPWD